MPSFTLHLNEFNRQQALVNLDDLWNDDRHREIFLDQLFIQVQGQLNILLLVVPVVPDIKLAIERIPLLRVFLLLELEQRVAIVEAYRVKFLLEVFEELGRAFDISGWVDGLDEDTCLMNTGSIFNHLYFRYVVRPSAVL